HVTKVAAAFLNGVGVHDGGKVGRISEVGVGSPRRFVGDGFAFDLARAEAFDFGSLAVFAVGRLVAVPPGAAVSIEHADSSGGHVRDVAKAFFFSFNVTGGLGRRLGAA